jgi:outer membrane protein
MRYWQNKLIIIFGLTILECVVFLPTFGVSGQAPAPATTILYQNESNKGAFAPRPSAAGTPAAQAKPERPEGTAKFSLFEAIGQALKSNQKIQVSSYDPKKASQDLQAAKAVYDPSVFSSGNRGNVRRPTNTLLDTGTIREDVLLEQRWFFNAGSKKFFPSGTTVAIYQEMDRLNSNSLFVVPDPQSTSRVVVEVSQPLLKGFWDRNNRALINVAKLTVDITNEDFRQTVMDVVADVGKVYWQLVLERQFDYINRVTVDMAEELHRREHVRMQRGISTQLDADRALAAVELRRADLLRSRTRIKSISDQLKLLLNLPDTSPEIFPVTTPVTTPAMVNIDEAMADSLKNRPELERAQNVIDVSKTRMDLARHNRLPKLDAGVRLTKNGLGSNTGRAVGMAYGDAFNNWLGSLQFEFPLGNRAAKAEYSKRSLEYNQSNTEAGRVKDQILTEVSLAVRDVNLAQKEIPTTLKAQNAAERVVEGENARFELGQRTNEELLRAQDLLAAAAREHARAIINYNISLVALSRAKGTILKDMGIEIKD